MKEILDKFKDRKFENVIILIVLLIITLILMNNILKEDVKDENSNKIARKYTCKRSK